MISDINDPEVADIAVAMKAARQSSMSSAQKNRRPSIAR
jgi:hypothetical protein